MKSVSEVARPPAPATVAPVPASLAPVVPVSTAPVPAAPVLPLLASEAAILADHPSGTTAYRFVPQPNIVILQFASLADQASALNRAAALVEKAGYPRDRVLDEAELNRRIRAEGGTPSTFYYGHDYRASDILRVFGAIDMSGTPLTDGEAQLRQRVTQWGWQPGTNAALISLVADDPTNGIDRTMRATILRHELSHGAFFTTPDYARYSGQFWNTILTDGERALFRKFLAGEGYDVTLEELVINETQAYLMHTASDLFFNAKAVGIPQARLDLLRALFLTGMPPGWLRDCTTVPETLPRRRTRRGLGARRRTARGRTGRRPHCSRATIAQ